MAYTGSQENISSLDGPSPILRKLAIAEGYPAFTECGKTFFKIAKLQYRQIAKHLGYRRLGLLSAYAYYSRW